MANNSGYRVCRAPLDLEDPWRRPDAARTQRLVGASDGKSARLFSEFFAYHDGVRLYVVFSVDDDHVVATHLEHDASLYEEDVVELFLSPERLETYFEIEVNPLGTTFDARIDSPDLDRKTMRADRSWTCAGLRAAIRRISDAGVVHVDTVLAIPFASVAGDPPAAGATWRANFFRIDRSPSGDEFLAWRPTSRKPADFHVPRAFGTIVFD
jgi:hypothetical protein